MPKVRLTIAGALFFTVATSASAQWTHRYPKIQGMSHHVYLEGYELPALTVGPMDPAVAPDGRRIAFGARGWLWILELDTGIARRITSGAGMDSRPAWSPDGRRIAFVRDDTRFTKIYELDLVSGRERALVDTPFINLDPSYSTDGSAVYYSSSSAGDLDLWRLDPSSGATTRITTATGSQELKVGALADGKRLVYVAKAAGNDLRVRDVDGGEERTLRTGPILSTLRPVPSPDGRSIAVTWPAADGTGWALELVPVDGATFPIHLTHGNGLPITPAWHPDGRTIFYVEADHRQVMRLYRISADGGDPTEVPIATWDWAAPTGRVRITTSRVDLGRPVAARVTATDRNGHPLIPDEGQPRFDGQNGLVFFYSEGSVEVTAPIGPVTVAAVQGLMTPVKQATETVADGQLRTIGLNLQPVWNARAAGWLAGEHHFHLNYGGPYQLPPEVLAPMARGEGMDVLTPLLANLHTRFEDQPLFQWKQLGSFPWIAWGQEIRSHFLGHLGLIGTAELHWPWIWGPGYQVHGRDDRTNGSVLAFSRSQGGVSSYVHPITGPNPFSDGEIGKMPVELVADGILNDFDTIELACLWSDEIGSMQMWYQLLNFGSTVALSAGTDVMNNLYRTMAVGTTSVYVRSDTLAGYRGYLTALKEGRSFVTNGPMLELDVGQARPGDIIVGGKKTAWTLSVHSAVPVDSVQIVVNGRVVATHPWSGDSTTVRYAGTVALPKGGWIAARALGGLTTKWPAMDSYAFAHTAPVWIGSRGATMPDTRKAAAETLSKALVKSLERLRQGYGTTQISALESRFAQAMMKVQSVIDGPADRAGRR